MPHEVKLKNAFYTVWNLDSGVPYRISVVKFQKYPSSIITNGDNHGYSWASTLVWTGALLLLIPPFLGTFFKNFRNFTDPLLQLLSYPEFTQDSPMYIGRYLLYFVNMSLVVTARRLTFFLLFSTVKRTLEENMEYPVRVFTNTNKDSSSK